MGYFVENQCEIVITIWEGISFPISNEDISNYIPFFFLFNSDSCSFLFVCSFENHVITF